MNSPAVGLISFVTKEMNAYLFGGMSAESTARFTRGELLAIYKGDHRSRDASLAFRVTPPPEALGIEAAMKKADVVILELGVDCEAVREKAATLYRKVIVKKGTPRKARYVNSPGRLSGNRSFLPCGFG
jgi:hypothetical protein